MKKRVLVLCLFIISFCSCSKKETEEEGKVFIPTSDVKKLDSLNRPIDSTAWYFPIYEFEAYKKKYKEVPNLDSQAVRHFSMLLYRYKEPILSSKFLEHQMYRLVLGDEKVVRLVKYPDQVRVIIKYGAPQGPYRIVKNLEFAISTTYWDTLTYIVKTTHMWSLPKYDPNKEYFPMTFFFEGHKESGYAHLGASSVVKGYNDIETRNLLYFFSKIEKLGTVL